MKRLVSVFLAVLTLFLCLAPALSATASDAPLTDDGLPVVVVRGMDSDDLTVDPRDGSPAMRLKSIQWESHKPCSGRRRQVSESERRQAVGIALRLGKMSCAKICIACDKTASRSTVRPFRPIRLPSVNIPN